MSSVTVAPGVVLTAEIDVLLSVKMAEYEYGPNWEEETSIYGEHFFDP